MVTFLSAGVAPGAGLCADTTPNWPGSTTGVGSVFLAQDSSAAAIRRQAALRDSPTTDGAFNGTAWRRVGRPDGPESPEPPGSRPDGTDGPDGRWDGGPDGDLAGNGTVGRGASTGGACGLAWESRTSGPAPLSASWSRPSPSTMSARRSYWLFAHTWPPLTVRSKASPGLPGTVSGSVRTEPVVASTLQSCDLV